MSKRKIHSLMQHYKFYIYFELGYVKLINDNAAILSSLVLFHIHSHTHTHGHFRKSIMNLNNYFHMIIEAMYSPSVEIPPISKAIVRDKYKQFLRLPCSHPIYCTYNLQRTFSHLILRLLYTCVKKHIIRKTGWRLARLRQIGWCHLGNNSWIFLSLLCP